MTQKQTSNKCVMHSLTLMSAFLMGYIDAYTFIVQDGSFASAQTGNLVGLSVKIFSGEFVETVSHFSVFSGFALGAFIGQALLAKFKWQRKRKQLLILLLQAILLACLALFQAQLNGSLMIFFLGLLAGHELTVFRKFKGTKVNNGIMTGNTKHMMTHLYKAFFESDKQARSEFIHISTVIITFLLGAGIGALVLKINLALNLWGAFIIVVISLLITSLSQEEVDASTKEIKGNGR